MCCFFSPWHLSFNQQHSLKRQKDHLPAPVGFHGGAELRKHLPLSTRRWSLSAGRTSVSHWRALGELLMPPICAFGTSSLSAYPCNTPSAQKRPTFPPKPSLIRQIASTWWKTLCKASSQATLPLQTSANPQTRRTGTAATFGTTSWELHSFSTSWELFESSSHHPSTPGPLPSLPHLAHASCGSWPGQRTHQGCSVAFAAKRQRLR